MKCDKCHQNSVRNGHELAIRIGCSVCAGRTVVPGYNDIPTTAPWMVPYFSGGVEEASKYTCSSGKKFTPICPNCGRLSDHKTSPNRLMKNHSIGCSCGDGISIPNKFIWSVFEQLMGQNKISDFQREYQITDREGTPRKIDIYFETLDGSEYCV